MLSGRAPADGAHVEGHHLLVVLEVVQVDAWRLVGRSRRYRRPRRSCGLLLLLVLRRAGSGGLPPPPPPLLRLVRRLLLLQTILLVILNFKRFEG